MISIFVNKLLADLPITIYGDGLQTRDFVYAGDVAESVCRAALGDSTGAQVMNVATGESITLLDLVEALRRVTGVSAKVSHQPARAGDIRFSAALVSRLVDAFGFQPRITVDEGLTKLLGISN